MRIIYECPLMEIITFVKDDVITTSQLEYTPEGSGGSKEFDDLLGELGVGGGF